MPPWTALVSASSLPVANYSSGHLADLLAESEVGESDEHDPSETWNIPAICHPHSCLPNQERKLESVQGSYKEKKNENANKEQKRREK